MSAELVHVALGGTISMETVDGLAVPVLDAGRLAEVAGIDTTPLDLTTVGGPQLTYDNLVAAVNAIRDAEARRAVGVIVTLGTDAMEEVSAFLAYAGPWDCNVVITGSMEPGGEAGSDGPQNLRDAARVARGTRLSEPVVVFAGRVMLARAVLKVSALERAAFASPTVRSWEVAEVLASRGLPGSGVAPPLLGTPGQQPVEVPILLSALFLGSGSVPPPPSPPPALVCVAAGAGSLTPDVSATAEAALAAGSVVAIATRALDGQLAADYGYPGGSGTLAGAGAILARGMTPHRVRIFLLIGVSQGLRGVELSSRLIDHVAALGLESVRVG